MHVTIPSDGTTNNTESPSKAVSADSDQPSGNQTWIVNNREIQGKAANIALGRLLVTGLERYTQ